MVEARCTAVFATAIGDCAVAWNDVGLTGVWLPAASPEALRRRLRERCASARETVPSGAIATLMEAIARLLAGEHVAFDSARLDLADTDDFDASVYAVARTIAAGQVLTYGDVAARVGGGASARAVGQSLSRNPWPIVVPCHRVVAAGNRLGGFSAPGGTATKRRMLAIEGARPAGPPGLFDADAAEPDDGAGVSGREARSGP